MDSESTAAQSRWLYVPQSVIAVRHMEGVQQLGALGPKVEPHLGGSPNPDLPDCNSHMWITEETEFPYNSMVQPVHFQNVICSFHLVKI